jgi:hypothetical protein
MYLPQELFKWIQHYCHCRSCLDVVGITPELYGMHTMPHLPQGLPKRVGFWYEPASDTVDAVTAEMVMNLSVGSDQVSGG